MNQVISTEPSANETKPAPTAATSRRGKSRQNASLSTDPETLRLFLRALLDNMIDAKIPVEWKNAKDGSLMLKFPSMQVTEKGEFIEKPATDQQATPMEVKAS